MHAWLWQRNELSSHVLLGADAQKEIDSSVNEWINILHAVQGLKNTAIHPTKTALFANTFLFVFFFS